MFILRIVIGLTAFFALIGCDPYHRVSLSIIDKPIFYCWLRNDLDTNAMKFGTQVCSERTSIVDVKVCAELVREHPDSKMTDQMIQKKIESCMGAKGWQLYNIAVTE